ncbi:ferritin-like domain-containing protein [Mesorhizobium sp. M7D.F.Ca.US.004.03.1.1]|uniref:YciE/YciF ferroxidase family protein n=1 Tax=Mesorhizobium sp. M7D.F.Ca.US.004.03.1.1 TaxID=2496702 RepID=UPI000FCB8FBD|nr:ferritin-like domain-containing protein [Mesorhizobium sp. M7D.F.Ca.US.004.03.1.1]RVA34333.1 ferritin-like domain-containing protein [Mesorhizobium sp. M7D.F.Ca.US.004.03.1.1]
MHVAALIRAEPTGARVHTLQDIYYAEQQIEKSLPKMIEKATDPDLRAGFEEHLEQTREHIARLEQVFEIHGEAVKGVDCPAINGILEEADDVSGDVDDQQVLDAALIASAQAVEHYEMTRYGKLIAWAKELGHEDSASILAETLEEERATDQKLTEMAESGVNRQAA